MGASKDPYASFRNEDLILRDHLAIDRTVLANERTLLAYVRTALAFLVVGGSLLKFFGALVPRLTGAVSIGCGVMLFLVGARRYHAMKSKIEGACSPQNHPSAPGAPDQ